MRRGSCSLVAGAFAVAGVLLLLGGGLAAAMSRDAAQKAAQFEQQKNWSALLQLAKQAVDADPRDGFAWYTAGLADDGLGKKAEAVKAYETALPLMASYMRSAVIQVLAQDYAALKETGKLVKLYQEAKKTNPEIGVSLKSQFGPLLAQTLPPPPPPELPDISPRSVAALTAKVRRSWRPDAVPLIISLSFNPGSVSVAASYGWYVDYYSPATKTGLMVTPGLRGMSAIAVAAPRWGTAAIPAEFVSLAAALVRVSGTTAPGALKNAVLFNDSDDAANPDSLVWDMGIATLPGGARVIAYVMSPEELDRRIAAAKSGNVRAEYDLALAYATGVANNRIDSARAVFWLKQAAARHDAQAENKLGQFYQLGFGMTADPRTASTWYLAAAKAGYAPAEFNLGLLYETGLGVRQDWIKADYWITEAAKRGLQAAYAEMTIVRNAAKRELHAEQLAAAQRAAASVRKPFMAIYPPMFHTAQYNEYHNAHPEAPEQDGPPY